MDIKVYKTNNTRFPWTAEDAEGHKVNGSTKQAAINTLRNLYQILPKVHEDQSVKIPNEVKLI